jgi:hypothetical protein
VSAYNSIRKRDYCHLEIELYNIQNSNVCMSVTRQNRPTYYIIYISEVKIRMIKSIQKRCFLVCYSTRYMQHSSWHEAHDCLTTCMSQRMLGFTHYVKSLPRILNYEIKRSITRLRCECRHVRKSKVLILDVS